MSVLTAVAVPAAGTGAAPGRPRRTGRPSAALLIGLVLLATIPVAPDRLLLLDVACVVGLPLLVVTMVNHRRLGLLVLVTLTWAFGQLLADVSNGLGPRASQAVVTAVTVLLGTTALIRLAGDNAARLRMLIAAVVTGLAAGSVVFSGVPLTSPADLWKYALGAPVTIAVLALCDVRWRAGSHRPTFTALVTLTAVDVLLDFRSLALLTLFTLVLYAVTARRGPRIGRATVVLTGAVVCVLLALGFVTAARAGWLGERSAGQVGQGSTDLYTAAVNVRPETVQSIYLISQRPITGYGSLPRLDSATFADSLDFVTAHGVKLDVNLRRNWQRDNAGVAQHSMVFGTTVMAGILALPFWIFLWVVGVRAGITAVQSRASPLVAFWSLLMLWDTLFSPLTGLYHVQLAAYLALVLLPLAGSTHRPTPPRQPTPAGP